MAGCRKLLMATEAKQFQTAHPVIAIKDTATVGEALKALSDAHILSAPVVLAPGGDAHAKSPLWHSHEAPEDITGWLDVRDMLRSFLQEVVGILELGEGHHSSLLQRMRVLEEKGEAFAQTQIKNLTNVGLDGDFLHSTQAKISLMELVSKGMLQPKLRAMHGGETVSHVVHRIALFNSKGAITDIISQSDIIKFLAGHPNEMGALGNTTMQELGFCNRTVESIPPSVSVLEAMKLILDKKISSLAVLGPDGAIIGNFSVCDLRSIMADQFGTLALPVGDFLAHEHGLEYVAHNHHKAPELRHAGDAGGTAGDGGADAAGGAATTSGRPEVHATAGHQFAASFRARKHKAAHTAGEVCGQVLELARADTTLVEVMSKMAKHRIHRVYVVDDALRPCGIVTCTDVLRKIVESTN